MRSIQRGGKISDGFYGFGPSEPWPWATPATTKPETRPGKAPAGAWRLNARCCSTARICADPYDLLLSVAVSDDNPQERMAEFGDLGFIEFKVDEAAQLIRIYAVVWVG